MDCRVTIDRPGFVTLLENARKDQSTVNLLVDDGGLTRMQGQVSSVTPLQGDVSIAFYGGQTILLSQIVALNGFFASDYTEC